MAAAKWQQTNGAKKCENGGPKTVRNREPKSAKPVESKRIQAKKCENDGMLSMIVFFCQFFPVGGHIAAI